MFTQRVSEYDDEDVVDALVGPDGVPRAYPRWITVWHEVVNDVFAGEPVAVALSGELLTERLEQVSAPEVFWFAW